MSEQFSMMKKAGLFILCLICTLAFSIPVFAESYTLTGADVTISDAGTISSYKLKEYSSSEKIFFILSPREIIILNVL